MVRLRNHESHFYVDVLEDLHTFLSKIFALMPWLRLFKNINHILSRPYDVSTSPLSFIFHDYLLINVREHRRGNQKRTIQRNLQHSVIRKLFIKNQILNLTILGHSQELRDYVSILSVFLWWIWVFVRSINILILLFEDPSRSRKRLPISRSLQQQVWRDEELISISMLPLEGSHINYSSLEKGGNL
jgi:hypothetical protein